LYEDFSNLDGISLARHPHPEPTELGSTSSQAAPSLLSQYYFFLTENSKGNPCCAENFIERKKKQNCCGADSFIYFFCVKSVFSLLDHLCIAILLLMVNFYGTDVIKSCCGVDSFIYSCFGRLGDFWMGRCPTFRPVLATRSPDLGNVDSLKEVCICNFVDISGCLV
jgi:hypothetical protein